MGDVLFHSTSSAKQFGGIPEDYADIHKFMDESKSFVGDWRHRILFHGSHALPLLEQIFGVFWTRKSDGGKVATRTIATQHIIEDLGFIPTLADWCREMPIRPWMNGITPRDLAKLQNADHADGVAAIKSTVHWRRGEPEKVGVYHIAFEDHDATLGYWDGTNWEAALKTGSLPAAKVLYYAELPFAPCGADHHGAPVSKRQLTD